MIEKNNIINKKLNNKIRTLFLIDILHLRDINSIYGFANGNYIIKQVYVLIKEILKKEIIPLVNKEYKKDCKINFKNIYLDVFALKIHENLEQNFIIKIKDLIFNKVISHKFLLKNIKCEIQIDLTIGCSQSSDKRLRIYTEKALHCAKKEYAHFMFYDSSYYKSELLNMHLLEIIKDNIVNKKVEPYLQAISCNKTSKIIKYEALMRIFDKKGKVITPINFIEKSKQYRLYTQLMIILIEKVISYIKEYKIHISINLAFSDILNPLVKNNIISKLKGTDIGKYLTIEILESEKINNFDMVNEFIQELKKYNVKIAIDDFGTGFSNYEHILKLNIDYIKIDGSLIKRIDEKIYKNLIKSIVYFCKEQEIKVIAEFVSNLKISRYVKSLDIDYSQGYYISKAVPIKSLMKEKNEK